MGGAQPHSSPPLRYSRAQLTQIITYGRPGTPMPAWGVASGKGALNEQSIHDLVNYLESIATTPDKAQARRGQGRRRDAQDARERRGADRGGQVGRRLGRRARRRRRPSSPRSRRRDAEQTSSRRRRRRARTRSRPRSRSTWQQTTQSATDGEVLFMNNCARCHTAGWSYFDPTNPRGQPAAGPDGQRRVRAQPHRRRRRPSSSRRRLGDAELLRLDQRRRAGQRGATASAASRRAACRTSAPCSPRPRSRRSWTTSGACRSRTTCP